MGAEPGLAPEPAPDADLLLVHRERYLQAVRRLSEDPYGPPEAGIGHGGDDPAFRLINYGFRVAAVQSR